MHFLVTMNSLEIQEHLSMQHHFYSHIYRAILKSSSRYENKLAIYLKVKSTGRQDYIPENPIFILEV